MSRLILIDETYQIPREKDREPFYAFAAVCLPRELASEVRFKTRELVKSCEWHTRDQLRSNQGRTKITEFLNLVAEESNQIIFWTDRIEISDRLAEAARARLFRQLLGALELVPSNSGDLVRYEKRFPYSSAAADLRVLREMRLKKLLTADHQIFPTSPSEENLLWLPDLVASAFRQKHVWNRAEYLAIIEPTLTIFKS